jgi:hypothetical protein
VRGGIIEIQACFEFGEPFEMMLMVTGVAQELQEHLILQACVNPMVEQGHKALFPALEPGEPFDGGAIGGARRQELHAAFGEDIIARACAGSVLARRVMGMEGGRGHMRFDQTPLLQAGQPTPDIGGGVLQFERQLVRREERMRPDAFEEHLVAGGEGEGQCGQFGRGKPGFGIL